MDATIQKLLDVKNYALATIKPTQKENNVTYIGTIHELGLDLYQYNEWYVDDWTDPENPVELPMVPAGTLMMASTHAKYSMYYGAISILTASRLDRPGALSPPGRCRSAAASWSSTTGTSYHVRS